MTVLAIVGVVLTVLFGGLSVYFYIKGKKYPGDMQFYVLDVVTLADSKKKRESIRVSFADKEIKSGLSYVKGLCVNTGNKDVDLNSVPEKDSIKVQLPEKCKWLEVSQTESSEGVELAMNLKNDHPDVVTIRGGLFKKNEMFSFEGFVEGDPMALKANIHTVNFLHRLVDVGAVKVGRLPLSRIGSRVKSFIMGVVQLFLMICALPVMIWMYYCIKPVHFVKANETDGVVYSAKVTNSGLIDVKESLSGISSENEQYTIDEFNDNFEATNVAVNGNKWLFYTIIGLYVISVILFAWLNIYWYKDSIKKRSIARAYEKLQSNSQNNG